MTDRVQGHHWLKYVTDIWAIISTVAQKCCGTAVNVPKVYFSVTCSVCSIKTCVHVTNNISSQKSQLQIFLTLTDANYHASFQFPKDSETDYNKSR